MRQNVIIALLSVIATLLAVSVFTPSNSAVGQNAGGSATVGTEVAVATGSLTGGNSAFYIYDPGKKKVLAYVLGNKGLEVRAVRDVQFDLLATEVNQQSGVMTTVSAMRKAIGKTAKKDEKESE